MKPTTSLALFIVTLILFGCTGCTKDKYTIQGHIYERCGVPAGNKTFTFHQPGGGGGTLGTATTDAAGKFSITFNVLNDAAVSVGIPLNVGYSEYGAFYPTGGDVSTMDVLLYGQPTTYLKVSIKVYNNTYTNRDTLYMADYRRTTPPFQLAIPGPFTSQVLYSIPAYPILDNIWPITMKRWGYKLNSEDYTYKLDTIRACDTTNFVIDVK